jgi:predicted phosphodiesterase
MTNIWMLGDVHGNFGHVMETIERTEEIPAAVIFLGDLECQTTFSDCICDLENHGVQAYFIPGNHDTDNQENFRNLWGDALFQERNLHGRVLEIAGCRVAGLGGVFRKRIWDPEGSDVPEIRNWKALATAQNKLRPHRLRIEDPSVEQISRDSELRKHASTIFYDDWFNLYGQLADILVTHEAPDCHPHGFKVITGLAQSMRVKAAFHGHHHEHRNYVDRVADLGFQAYSVGFMAIMDECGGQLRAGEF